MSKDPEKDQLRLATIGALRQEIQNRSAAQHALVSLNLTVLAAIGGIALAKGGSPDILLLLPLFCPLIGILYLDHATIIYKLGVRVRELYEDQGNEDVVGFEGQPGPFAVWFWLPMFLLFGLGPILGLGFTFVKGGAHDVLWWLGILFLVGYLVVWVVVFSRRKTGTLRISK